MNNLFKLGQYNLLLEKIPARMFIWAGNTNFICKLTFLNQFNFPVLSLNLHEFDIESICRYIFDFVEFNSNETYVPLSYYNESMCSYTLHIINESEEEIIIIKEFNPAQERIIDRIKLEFTLNLALEINMDLFSFAELLYTYFLQDNSDYSYIGDYLYGG